MQGARIITRIRVPGSSHTAGTTPHSGGPVKPLCSEIDLNETRRTRGPWQVPPSPVPARHPTGSAADCGSPPGRAQALLVVPHPEHGCGWEISPSAPAPHPAHPPWHPSPWAVAPQHSHGASEGQRLPEVTSLLREPLGQPLLSPLHVLPHSSFTSAAGNN